MNYYLKIHLSNTAKNVVECAMGSCASNFQKETEHINITSTQSIVYEEVVYEVTFHESETEINLNPITNTSNLSIDKYTISFITGYFNVHHLPNLILFKIVQYCNIKCISEHYNIHNLWHPQFIGTDMMIYPENNGDTLIQQMQDEIHNGYTAYCSYNICSKTDQEIIAKFDINRGKHFKIGIQSIDENWKYKDHDFTFGHYTAGYKREFYALDLSNNELISHLSRKRDCYSSKYCWDVGIPAFRGKRTVLMRLWLHKYYKYGSLWFKKNTDCDWKYAGFDIDKSKRYKIAVCFGGSCKSEPSLSLALTVRRHQ